jgi:uncharacterized delta-60 repeat protein
MLAIIARPLLAAEPRPGSVDLTFDAGQLNGPVPQTTIHTVVEDIAVQSDGRIYIGGHLNSVQGVRRDAIARLLPNGLLDATFQEHDMDFSLRSDTHRLFLQGDGRLLAGNRCVQRFHPDGTGDSSLTNCPNVIAILPGGKLLALPAESPGKPMRLNSDGTHDPSFSTSVNFAGPVLIEDDGRIVSSTWVEPDHTNRLVRLLPDGALDPSFTTVTFEPDPKLGGVYPGALARQPDGRYLLAGAFYTINQQRVGEIVRLNSDGTLDPSFTIADNLFLQGEPSEPFTSDDFIYALAVQPDGKILVGGRFANEHSVSRGGLVRLNGDGSVDSSFDIGSGVMPWESLPGFVKRIVLQSDGRILVSGGFDGFDGVPRSFIVRLNGDSPLLRLGSPERLPNGGVQISVADFTGRTTVVEAATELSPPNWQPIWTNTVSSNSFTFIDPDGSGAPRRFYRALAH